MARFWFLAEIIRRRSLGLVVAGAACAQFAVFGLTGVIAAPLPYSKSPLAIDVRASRVFEEPLVATGTTSTDEDQALAEAITSYQNQPVIDDFKVFDGFLRAYPQSEWRAALYTNLGLAYYHYGYFSKAIDSWELAWKIGKGATAPEAKALVDRAVGELARMHARLGHADRLATLFAEIGDRPVTGPATEAITGASEGLWEMRNNPGVAYLCGPLALKNLLMLQHASHEQTQVVDEFRSGPQGVSLAEVGRLAERANLPYRLAYREKNQPFPVPAIVHWKVSHFAVVTGEKNDRFHVVDPTFGTDLWITREAFDSESSGYFLIPTKTLEAGLREVSVAEASQVRGMGFTNTNDPNATRPGDETMTPDDGTCGGMCAYNAYESVVSLRLKDRPVGYAPPIGPSMYVSLTYNQREAFQPANFSFFNVSPKWTLNWLSYIQDDPTMPGANVSRYVAGGGNMNYYGYDSSNGGYFYNETVAKVAATLQLASANPVTYVRYLPDGGREVYSRADGATTFPRRIFLKQIFDPAGNAVTLNYDNQFRLTSITDATGRNTTFSYGLVGSPLLVTSITDPFGRSAQIVYDSSGRLSQITDVIGLTSRFTYDASSLINSMTTPYGTTAFSYGTGTGYGPSRFLEITDPLGNHERLEYLQGAPGIPSEDSPVPAGIVVFDYQGSSFMNGRDTYYWDKSVLPLWRGDYTKARSRHFLHDSTDPTGTTTSSVIESIKNPLERRIWRNFPGQCGVPACAGGTGSLDRPSISARVLDDGTTQSTQFTYNFRGKLTSIIDPIGRTTLYDYDTNNGYLIDLISVRQQTSPSVYSTIASFTYNSQHRPLTYTDAAGQTTTYTYNGAGQATQVTNPLGQTTRYEYDGLGYLTRIVNANGLTAASFTYDAFGRVATSTDSEAHTIGFAHDAMDRLTQVTYPDGTSYAYTWDKLDLSAVEDRLGRVTQYSHDAVRNLTAVTDPSAHTTRYSYYGNRQLKSVADPNGNTTSWDRDIQSRVTAKHFADGSQINSAYELTTSRLKSVTDALRQVKLSGYTVDDRLASIDYANAANYTPSVHFTYDPYFPRITSMIDGFGTTQYRYQAIGTSGALKLLAEDGPIQNVMIAYQYDALSRLVARTVDASAEAFTYDSLGRLSSHTSPLGSFVFGYLDQTNQLVSQQISSGTVGSGWAYDINTNDRRLKSITNGGNARGFQYTTTPENRIVEIDETASIGSMFPSQTWNYSYDASDRLLGAQASGGATYGYGYDAADNITAFLTPTGAVTATYNGVNQLTGIGGLPFSYNANGNLINDGQRTYLWDAENRLVAVQAPPSKVTKFSYDGLGRRIAIFSNSVNGANNARYLWCGTSLCQARTNNGVVTRQYYLEGEMRAGDQRLYYARDQLGSVRDGLDTTSGSSSVSYGYDPYGNLTQSVGNVSTDFRYAGMFFHEDSGLYLTRYRAYDPRTGRWLSRDPMEESAGANLYAYVADNPINLIDPSGEFLSPAGAALTGVCIALVNAKAIYDFLKAATNAGAACLEGSQTPDDALSQIQKNLVDLLIGQINPWPSALCLAFLLL
jgi:RHS repeat-associated protein